MIALVFSTNAFTQINFKAIASKTKLGVNQRLKISYEVDKQGADNFQVPNFRNFTIISGPSSSVSQSWVNGKSTFSRKYIYILQPKKIGTFVVPSATVTYNGEKFNSNTLKIYVTQKIELPDDPNNPEYLIKQGVHLVTEVSKSNPYFGESVFVSYKLYVKNTLGVRDVKLSGIPQFSGFWNQQIKHNNQRFVRATYKGQNDYYSLDLYKVLLIPQKSGKLVIEPAEIRLDLNIPTGRGDFFGNVISNGYRHMASSPKRTINVQQLPEEGKPADFSGAVGQFNFQVLRTNNSLKANEASEIKVVVSGTGNMKLFELPEVSFPSEIEVFTPESSEQLTTAYNGLRGSVSKSYTIVPQYKGKYKIPEVSFSFFNPRTRKYQTIKKNDLFVEALEGKEKPKSLTADDSSVAKNKITAQESFNFIALKTKLQLVKTKSDFFKSIGYYLLVLLLLLTIPLLIFLRKRMEKNAMDESGNRLKKADKLARKFLREAKESMGDHEQFYIALEKALHNFLKAKLKIETSDISKDKIRQLLLEKGVPSLDAQAFIEVLERSDFARYTPATQVMITKEYEHTAEVISKINKYL